MRVDKPQKQNTFNTILIAFFFLGSSNFLFIIFFRPNPIKYGTDLTDVITKYELCQEKYGVVNEKTLQQVSIEELLATSYAQKESLKNFRISTKRAEDRIRGDARFQTNGLYDEKKLVAYLENMRKFFKLSITQKDYLEYKKVACAKELLDQVHKDGLAEVAMGPLISSNCYGNIPVEVVVEGYRVEVAVEERSYEFTDREIQAFIKEQIRQKIGFYIIGENITGFIIKVPMNLGTLNVTNGVNFFLKQEKFNHEHLQSFMEQCYLQSDGFTKTVDYKLVMEKWKKNGKKPEKNVNISDFFQIEILSQVEENENNNFVFDNQSIYHKDFYPIGTTYYRVVIKEHKKEELKKLTKEDIDNYVIPTMKALAHKKATLAMAYERQFQHNNGEQQINTNHCLKVELKLPLYILEKENTETKRKNIAVVMYDVYDIPYILVITNVKKKMSPVPLNKGQIDSYVRISWESLVSQDIYKILFNIYYAKFKNQFKA